MAVEPNSQMVKYLFGFAEVKTNISIQCSLSKELQYVNTMAKHLPTHFAY